MPDADILVGIFVVALTIVVIAVPYAGWLLWLTWRSKGDREFIARRMTVFATLPVVVVIALAVLVSVYVMGVVKDAERILREERAAQEKREQQESRSEK